MTTTVDRVDRSDHSLLLRLIIGLAGAFAALLQFRGFSSSPMAYHAIRQTQTGWAIRTIARGGPVLRYEVPVYGPHWSYPLEFPTYQFIVGKLISLFGTGLEATAHTVSLVFWLGTLGMIIAVQRTLCRRLFEQQIVAVLYFACPVLTFWSHSVTIEFVVLFLVMVWVWSTLEWWLHGRNWALPVSCFFGALAAPSKFTTFAPAVAFVLLMLAYNLKPENGLINALRAVPRKRYLGIGASLFVAVVALSSWTLFTTKVYGENGASLKGGHVQVFGTLKERTAFAYTAKALWRFVVTSGTLWVPLVFVCCLVFSRRRIAWGFAGLASLPFFITPLIFFHLHVVHDYYAIEILPYLLVALASLVAGLAETGALACLFVSLIAGLFGYASFYQPQDFSKPALTEFAEVMQSQLRPDDVFIASRSNFGLMLSYFVDRRASEVPLIAEKPGIFAAKLNELRAAKLHVGAVIECNTDPTDSGKVLAQHGFVSIAREGNCEIWAPANS